MRFLALFIAAVTLAIMLPSLSCVAKPNEPVSISQSGDILEQVKSKNWLLLDVRSPEEFAQGHIPGAINISHEKITEYLSELKDYKDRPIVVYCRSGRRAKVAIEELEAAEFTDLRHLEGDMMGWSEAGLPIDQM